MKVSAIITLKKDVLDPQGKVIHQTLEGMNFKNVNEVRQGKYFEIDVNENDPKKAKEIVEDMCEKLLANLVIENYKIVEIQYLMKSSVITFPGSNCDRDMDVALKKFGFKNKMIWHNDNELPKSDLVVLPGGFSYGDYLRCGSVASKSKIMQSVINFAKSGGLVMGICNGFQILVETGLVPGVLLRNKYLEFICKNVFVKIDNKDNPYFKNLEKDIFELHIAHNEGNYFCTEDQLKEIKDNNQVAIYYCNNDGKIEEEFNPNGSIKNIAGILNKEKNVLGMMPHPERMIDSCLSGEDGSLFFKNLLNNIK